MPPEQRITLVQRNPNPLFVYWLEEWLGFAKQKKSRNEISLAKALESLRLYPLVLHTGRDCCILEGFGPTICQMLDKQLAAYRQAKPADGGGGPAPTKADLDRSNREVLEKVRVQVVRRERAKRARKQTTAAEAAVPAKQPTVVDLFRKYDQQTERQPLETETEVLEVPELPAPEPVIVKRGTFDIVLLVDTAETAGKAKRTLDTTIKELERHRVRFEVRCLSVGDFLWICRRNDTQTQAPEEFVLPHIVERKRMDDLAGSIKDGRFHEQKFRLCDSGIANVVYLVESCGASGNAHAGLPLQSLYQAATNTQVQNNFVVRFTESHVDSMRYLAVMTELLVEMYKDKDLRVSKTTKTATRSSTTSDPVPVLDFKAFADSTTKLQNFRVRDTFVRQLLQLRTLSVDKATAIVKRYPTPHRLLSAYAACDDVKSAELLLANLQCGGPKKLTIGPKISKTLYSFFHQRNVS